MKITDFRNPVRSAWLADQGFRIDASPYLSGAYEARKLLERLPGTQPLHQLTSGYDGGIFNGPKFSRLYTSDPECGVPFLSSTDMLEADFTNVPLLHKKVAEQLPYLEVEPGMTMITCSGTVGRTTYVRSDMVGFWSSQHTMKVNPDRDQVRPGYLYTCLRSSYGLPMIVNAAYGAIIQHIEPGHILDLPVPRFNEVVEEEIHRYVQTAADLRVKSQNGIASATRDLFESAGLSELMNLHWYRQPRETGFVVNGVSASSLRAVNYSARAGSIIGTLRSIPHRTIGDISQSGQLATGPRFKRIDTDPGNGIMLLGQRQGFWSRPTGRWISPRHTPKDVLVEDETVMIAEHGLVGENALIGRAILVSGGWTKYAYTQDFLRLKSGIDDFPGAYIFAFLRSEPAFRALRSMLVGTGPQEINIRMFENLPVPECTTADRQRIAEAVRQAYRWRDQADHMEDRAQDLLNMAVHDAVGADLQQDRSLVHRSEEPDGTGDG